MSMNKKFWVVTLPNSKSSLNDILFECDSEILSQQLEYGLKTKHILGMFEKPKAIRIASTLLSHIKTLNNING